MAAPGPTPFRDGTSIVFTVPVRARVRLDVYDLLGRRVRTLVDGPLEADRHSRTWDGRDDDGSPAAAGIYFVRMSAPGWTATRKAVLLR
jgi:flagellar hook assembly protein FlgD